MPKFDDFSQDNGYVRVFLCSEFRHRDAVPFAVNARAIGPTCPMRCRSVRTLRGHGQSNLQ